MFGLRPLHLNVSSHVDEQDERWTQVSVANGKASAGHRFTFPFFICLEKKYKKWKSWQRPSSSSWMRKRSGIIVRPQRRSCSLSGNASIWREKQMFSCKLNRMISSHPTCKDLLQVQLSAAGSTWPFSIWGATDWRREAGKQNTNTLIIHLCLVFQENETIRSIISTISWWLRGFFPQWKHSGAALRSNNPNHNNWEDGVPI